MEPAEVYQQTYDYARALRTHHLADDEIVEKLVTLGLTRENARQYIILMDKANWTAGSNSSFTIVGWMAMLIAIVVTGATPFFLMKFFTIPLGICQVIFVFPFVVLGILACVGFLKLAEFVGIPTSKESPLAIPDEKQLKAMIAEAGPQP